MPETRLAIKVDVDTDRGTRVGVPRLLDLFDEFGIKATFLFSLGPDNTGRAIRRIFRPGFFQKVARTSVVSTYGLRTLLNGVLWPGPHIGRRNGAILRAARDRGHEVGIHCYDHIRWQDGLARMSRAEVYAEFDKARREFERVFGGSAQTAGAAGWQANALSLAAYDDAGLLYASDTRGTHAFFPRANGTVFKTLQIPTTLPTLDELLGRPEHPEERLVEQYLSWLRPGQLNVLTAHAEIEGMIKIDLFHALLAQAQKRDVRFVRLDDLAREHLRERDRIPVGELIQGEVDGRSGTLAVQKAA
ncbi:polysaccharide deacetylase family protein [Sulfuricaulis sp.]|jgi:undecaprenyl phosphate-alpha-L-ara4FN deformylase|uniref:polysaccharide deacetylase family protein n=1 Tax=Sulfuricaulis sp. TaxID=2003553 RepID=UPI00355944D0